MKSPLGLTAEMEGYRDETKFLDTKNHAVDPAEIRDSAKLTLSQLKADLEELRKRMTSQLALVVKDSERARHLLLNTSKDVDEKLKLKKGEIKPTAEDVWHAEAPRDVLKDVKKLQMFVEDEVWLQFSHHFAKIQNQESKQRQLHGFSSEKKVSHMALRLMELESKQRQELEAAMQQNAKLNPFNSQVSVKEKILKNKPVSRTFAS